MKRALRCVVLASVLLASWGPRRPAAADVVTRYSLEWLVALHDNIVEGVVTAIKPLRGRTKLSSVTLKTTSPVLKGKHRAGFVAVVAGARLSVGQRVIIFAKTEYAPSSCGRDPRTGKLRLFARQRITRVLDGSKHWALPRRDFKLTHGLADLKRRIRAAARTISAKRSLALPIPPGSAISGGPMDAGTLIVPRDATTEQYLESLIHSRDTDQRIQGIIMLVAYESVAHIRLLLKLRRDPALREAAERVLRRWDVPLPSPARTP